MKNVKNTLKVAWLLTYTRVIRSGILSNLLIIIVMTLTFLNLLVVRGILIGLPAGAISANREKYYADVFISTKTGEKYLDRFKEIDRFIKNAEGIDSYAVRYIYAADIKADTDKRVSGSEKENRITPRILGVNPKDEDLVVQLSKNVLDGKMFSQNSTDEIVLGADLSDKYERAEALDTPTLEGVDVGSDLELTVNNITKKVRVAGFISSKTNELDGKAIVSQQLLKTFFDSKDYRPSEIAIRIKNGITPEDVKNRLVQQGASGYAYIETPEEYQPSFVEDIVATFEILGDVIGSIGLIVASITIFIIIFVNAITQRKQIGILKGIGISPEAIEISYILQALIYVFIAAIISFPFLYGVLVPYFLANPIDFPFSDGVLVAELPETIKRTLIMIFTTGVAGYIPARKVVKQNTLDAILGR